MNFWRSKRKIVTITAALLCFMMGCTLISKSVYAYSLPQITAEEAEKRKLGRQIRIYGSAAQSREYAVSTIPAVRVESVEVGRGDEVEEGALLFTLDMEDLEEQIARQELAIKKLEVEIATLQYNQKLADEEKVRDTNRLLEDYLDTAAENEIAVDRAKIREDEAQQDLQKHLEDAPQVTDSKARQAAWEEYEEWKARGRSLEEEVERLAGELDSAQKRVDEAQAALDEAQRAAGAFFSQESVSEPADSAGSTGGAEGSAAQSAGEDAGAEQDDSAGQGSGAGQDAGADADGIGETDISGEQRGIGEQNGIGEQDGGAEQEDGGVIGAEGDGMPDGENPGQSLTELQERLDEAAAERDACAAALENAEKKLQEHQAKLKTEPDFTAEDAAQKSWEEQSEALRRNAESADWAYQDAQRQKEKALEKAQRNVDDSVAPENLQDALALNQLELSYLREVLKEYQNLESRQGRVIADKCGVVTAVNVTAGNDTPDGAALVYADKEENLEFRMALTEEESKYVNLGTQGSLQIGGNQQNCAVEYLEQQPDGRYEAVIPLPEGFGSIGATGSFSTLWQSDTYQCCVPVNAVHAEGQRNYVYVVRRQQGILGEELAAEKRFVTVKEKGDSVWALDDLDVAEGEEVIVSSTKELADGDVVRYRLADDGSGEG